MPVTGNIQYQFAKKVVYRDKYSKVIWENLEFCKTKTSIISDARLKQRICVITSSFSGGKSSISGKDNETPQFIK